MPPLLKFLLILSMLALYACYPHYSSNKTLNNCPSSCKTCSGIFRDICVECRPGHYLTSQGTCDSCDETCLQCSGPHSEACFQCKSALYDLIDGRCERLQRNLQTTNITLPNSSVQFTNGMYIYYIFNNDNTTNMIDMYFVFNQESWFGFGYGVTMIDVDMIVIEIVKGVVVVTDRWSTSWDSPSLDTSVGGTNDVTLIEYSLNQSMVIAHAQRKQNTGDSYDSAMSGPGQYSMMWAFSDAQKMEDHGSNALYVFANFTPGANTIATENTLAVLRMQILKIHGILMFVMWGIVAEVLTYLPRYFRTWKYYAPVHALLSWIITLVNIPFIIMPLVLDSELNVGYANGSKVIVAHFAFGLIVLILGTIQHFGGISLILRLKGYVGDEAIYMQRKMHMINGMLVLLVSKINLILGVVCGEPDLLILIIIYFIIFVLIRFPVEFWHRWTKNKSAPATYSQSHAKKLNNNQIQLLELLAKGQSLESIKAKLPNMKWCLLGNKVIDTTDFLHPGGNYIMEEVVGREVGRFLYGAYALETSTFTKPYLHSTNAFNLVNKYTIGLLDESKDTMLLNYKANPDQTGLQSIMGISPTASTFRQVWSLKSKEALSNTTSRFLFYSTEFLVANHVSGVRWMGRHFVLKFSSLKASTRLYTTILSMTDDNINLRKAVIEYFDGVMKQNKNVAFVAPDGIKEPKDVLPLVIKKYESPTAFSKNLHNLDINRPQENSVRIEGPVGRGLELNEAAKGTHVIFAAGTGLLPFLDLLNYLLMKSIYEVLIKQKSNALADSINVYGEMYSSTFVEGFNIVLYGSFASDKEMIGYDIVAKLAEISEVYKLNNFKAVIRGAKNQYFGSSQKRFDRSFLKENVGKGVEKVMICGPPDLNRELMNGLREQGIENDRILMV